MNGFLETLLPTLVLIGLAILFARMMKGKGASRAEEVRRAAETVTERRVASNEADGDKTGRTD